MITPGMMSYAAITVILFVNVDFVVPVRCLLIVHYLYCNFIVIITKLQLPLQCHQPEHYRLYLPTAQQRSQFKLPPVHQVVMVIQITNLIWMGQTFVTTIFLFHFQWIRPKIFVLVIILRHHCPFFEL